MKITFLFFFFVKSFRDLITCASYCQKDGLCKAFTLDYNYCRIIENLETADIVKIPSQSFKAREVWIKVDDSINDQEYQDSFDQCPTPELIDDGICDSLNNLQKSRVAGNLTQHRAYHKLIVSTVNNEPTLLAIGGSYVEDDVWKFRDSIEVWNSITESWSVSDTLKLSEAKCCFGALSSKKITL